MQKLIDKLGMGEKLRRNFIAILLVAAGGSIIYGLPYFRYDYYDVYLETYNLTNTQMGVFGSIFGIFGMISYFFGGYVADKFSTRHVLSVSLILTGLGGFVHLLPLSYGVLLVLYAMWGFTSLFAFWPACVKAVRILSDPTDQGKGFGIFEGARGVVAAIMAPLAVLAFNAGAKKLDDALGMKYIIIFYSVITVLSGILVYLKMNDENMESEDKVKFTDLGTVLKMPAIWIIGIVTFCTYVFTMSIYYFTPYATSLLGASVVFGATLAAMKRYISPISNVGGGFLSDKVGTSNLLLISFVVMGLGTAAILLLPLKSSMIVIFAILYLIIYFFYNVNSALTWAMMEEGNVPKRVSGTAAGVISTIGYLPEIFVSLLAGNLLDKYPGVTGYRYFFTFLIVMMAIGVVCVLIWRRHLEKNKGKDNN
ncbi:MFS transporter [Anaerosalibacter bizertensis]|uniref:MFS transporter n=1 Tax=Anaerosalibacter bizertensis TaxID=932217 RepID=UPI001C0E9583|nr:MFS transporter [Anaerosalibacter bizertensis]MBU5294284.1 MFS transporter [Anaerosalibacter bizertensis]